MGKPVYNKFDEKFYGAWLKDSNPRNDDYGEKIWATAENDIYHVYEYANKKNYRDGNGRNITLKSPFRVKMKLNFASCKDYIKYLVFSKIIIMKCG